MLRREGKDLPAQQARSPEPGRAAELNRSIIACVSLGGDWMIEAQKHRSRQLEKRTMWRFRQEWRRDAFSAYKEQMNPVNVASFFNVNSLRPLSITKNPPYVGYADSKQYFPSGPLLNLQSVQRQGCLLHPPYAVVVGQWPSPKQGCRAISAAEAVAIPSDHRLCSFLPASLSSSPIFIHPFQG